MAFLTETEELALTQRAKAGETAAIQELILKFMPLVRNVASKYYNTNIAEDLHQVGVLGLYHAISKFKPELGVHFGTYAKFWVRWYMQSEYASEMQQMAIMHKLAAFKQSDAWLTYPRELMESADELDLIYKAIIMIEPTMTDRDRAILVLRLKQDLTMQEAADQLGLSRQRVHQLEHIILTHLRTTVDMLING